MSHSFGLTVGGREVKSASCPCGGVPLADEPTAEEERAHGCGRPGCCVAAIACQGCGTRWRFALEAPELRHE